MRVLVRCAVPICKTAGAQVVAGTGNQSGALVVRADSLPGDCTATQLNQLVSASQAEQGRRALLLERFTKWYTLLVLLAAAALATVPLSWCQWGDIDELHERSCEWWQRRALVLTVISCPCSLVVAMPITFACGVSALAKWGILVKSSKQMDLLARVSRNLPPLPCLLPPPPCLLSPSAYLLPPSFPPLRASSLPPFAALSPPADRLLSCEGPSRCAASRPLCGQDGHADGGALPSAAAQAQPRVWLCRTRDGAGCVG